MHTHTHTQTYTPIQTLTHKQTQENLFLNSLGAINRSSGFGLLLSFSFFHFFFLIQFHCSVDVCFMVESQGGSCRWGVLSSMMQQKKPSYRYSMKRYNNRVSLFLLGKLRALLPKNNIQTLSLDKMKRRESLFHFILGTIIIIQLLCNL